MNETKEISRGRNGLIPPIAADRLAAAGAPARELEKSPVVRTLRLLGYLARCGEPVALAELSRALALPKATVHRLARLLEEVGFVDKNPLSLRYSVGGSFEDIALGALRSGGNRRRLLLDQLAEQLGVRVNFCVLKSGKLTFVEWVESSSPIRIDLKPGVPVPVHASASGKLLIAFAPDEARERFLAGAPFHAFTRATITDGEAMRRELALIRRRGHAEDNQEFLAGISCLAVPVRNLRGEVVAGLGVMAPAHDFPLTQARHNLPLIRGCAERIAAEAGGQGPAAGAPGGAPRAGAMPTKPVAVRGRSA